MLSQAGIAAAQKAVKDIARKMASDKMIMYVPFLFAMAHEGSTNIDCSGVCYWF
jgi:hypothetical protein